MKKIGFLISGSGSTLQNFIDLQKEGKLKGQITVVISSKKEAYGLERAKNAGIPFFSIEYKNYQNNIKDYSREITKILINHNCDIVVMGGFMSFYDIPDDFKNKVVNIHPSLIPAFCGKGMYGKKVHETVIANGVKVTGCTVHFVDNEYDHGPIIAQETVRIEDEDTVESLAHKVQAKERAIYPQIVNQILDDLFTVKDKKVLKKTL
ncbi:MAG TPA: phosphoribosylglycinamide formyltransferase [Spirochaetia bacterium]|nr:phosphoribosylglycinamide formyltransferase [Spirochaetia bacterium]